MKILLVGSEKHWAIERYFVKYLRSFGADVRVFPAHDIVYNYHTASLINKILFRSKLRTLYPSINRSLLSIATEWKPDIIWIFKGMEVYPATLKQLRKQHIKLCNYNPDHPFIFKSRGSGNENVRKGVPFYDLHFCYQHDLGLEIENKFGIATEFLPFSYEASEVEFHPDVDESQLIVCFQGNPDRSRIETIKMLADAGVPVHVYGHNWEKVNWEGRNNLKCFPIQERKVFWKLMQVYRVQLNLFRDYNIGSHNMRSFEIPAAGGIQLAPDSKEQRLFFENGKEIFLFSSPNEMISMAKELLSLSKEEATRIRIASRKRVIESGYTFRDRSEKVYSVFKRMLS